MLSVVQPSHTQLADEENCHSLWTPSASPRTTTGAAKKAAVLEIQRFLRFMDRDLPVANVIDVIDGVRVVLPRAYDLLTHQEIWDLYQAVNTGSEEAPAKARDPPVAGGVDAGINAGIDAVSDPEATSRNIRDGSPGDCREARAFRTDVPEDPCLLEWPSGLANDWVIQQLPHGDRLPT